MVEGLGFPGARRQRSLSMNLEDYRELIQWHREYRRDWDLEANEYAKANLVGWGKTRRLGSLRSGRIKAYVGVQHVDTNTNQWAIADEPFARFFLSLFVDGSCVTLRTFPTMDAALEALKDWANLG
jgi:hypothetical protein